MFYLAMQIAVWILVSMAAGAALGYWFKSQYQHHKLDNIEKNWQEKYEKLQKELQRTQFNLNSKEMELEGLQKKTVYAHFPLQTNRDKINAINNFPIRGRSA